MPANPLSVHDDLRAAYLRYFDTAFWLRDPRLMAERRRLLEDSSLLFTDPLLEPVLPYDATVPLAEVCEQAGISPQTGEIVGRALFGAFTAPGSPVLLRAHQAEAVLRSFRPGTADGRNVIVTSGTGSGKTESFLLPVLLRLVGESASWAPQPGAARWWATLDGIWHPSRGSETRPAAVRALILYPTNALVEDQMVRLRRAVRRIGAADERSKLWFGRYTGSTLGGATMPADGKDEKVFDAAVQLSEIVKEYDALAKAGTTQEDLAQFADPRAHEMLTRWDMIAAPPDVLVTNYSMLNAMLMREVEQPMFDATARWLRASAANVLTLVVDELHLYRGTQGSEVAMVIRNLLMRLGLEPDSPQLRVIGTSASLAGHDEGLRYLQEFFGVPKASFAVVPGKTRDLGEPVRLDRAAILAGRDRTPPPVPAAELSRAVALACWDERGKAVPRHHRSGTSPGGCSVTMTTAPPPGPCLRRSRPPNRRLVRFRCGPTCSSGWSAACGHAPTPPAAACRTPTGTVAPSAACSPFPRRPVPTVARECSSCCTATNAVTSASAATSSSVPRKAGSSSAPPRRTSPRSKRSPSAAAAMASTCGTGRASGPSSKIPAGPRACPTASRQRSASGRSSLIPRSACSRRRVRLPAGTCRSP